MTTPLRARFIAAQLGARKNSQRSLSMLAEPADLPGSGWRVLDERTWRTGVGNDEAWAQRARATKSITAWRSFESRPRWLWTQVTPLASPADAHDALRAVPALLLANLSSRVTVTSTREVDITIEGATTVWAREDVTTGGLGDGASLLVAWVATNAVCALACSSLGDEWRWPDAISVATCQTRRIASTTTDGASR